MSEAEQIDSTEQAGITRDPATPVFRNAHDHAVIVATAPAIQLSEAEVDEMWDMAMALEHKGG